MRPVSVERLADWVGGRLVGVEPAVATDVVAGPDVLIDSRVVSPRSLFVALAGDHSDGHAYVAAAHAAGAAAALVDHAIVGAGPQIVVPDPIAALAELGRAVLADVRARQHAEQRAELRVIGITGSSGKTSVKDLLAQVLSRVAPTIAPLGSFNNEIGVPLTASRVDSATRFLISEMGARGIGHIRYLCQITPPDVAVVLNVGQAHVGEFGSADRTALAKGELVEALGTGPASEDRYAVLNATDERVAAMAARTSAKVIWFVDPAHTGPDDSPDPPQPYVVWASGVTADDADRARFTLHLRTPAGSGEHPVTLGVSGRHQVANALAAAGAALACGLTGAQIATGLTAAVAVSHWRMEIAERPDATVVLNDAYNANPDSMAAALDTLVAIGRRRSRPTAAVLGGMLELGATSASAHEDLGRRVHELGIGQLVTVGDLAAGIADGAVAAGMASDQVLMVQDKTGLADRLVALLGAGTIVLVKASRGMGLETVAAELLAAGSDHGQGQQEGGTVRTT